MRTKLVVYNKSYCSLTKENRCFTIQSGSSMRLLASSTQQLLSLTFVCYPVSLETWSGCVKKLLHCPNVSSSFQILQSVYLLLSSAKGAVLGMMVGYHFDAQVEGLQSSFDPSNLYRTVKADVCLCPGHQLPL